MMKKQIHSENEETNPVDIISPYVYPILKLSTISRHKYYYLPKRIRMNQQDVIDTIAKEYNVDVQFPFIVNRRRELTEARQIMCKIFVFELQMRKTEVARFLKKDHTTVIHACHKFDELYVGCNVFKEKADNIYRTLNLSV